MSHQLFQLWNKDEIEARVAEIYPDPLPHMDVSSTLWLRQGRVDAAISSLHLDEHHGDLLAMARCDGACRRAH